MWPPCQRTSHTVRHHSGPHVLDSSHTPGSASESWTPRRTGSRAAESPGVAGLGPGVAGPKKIIRTRRDWTVLGQWDRNEKLDFDIKTELMDLATAHMTRSGLVEWPTVKSNASKMKRLGMWAQVSGHNKNNGMTSVESYCCPLKISCKGPCQIRVTKGFGFVKLECSGGEHTPARCYAVDFSKYR